MRIDSGKTGKLKRFYAPEALIFVMTVLLAGILGRVLWTLPAESSGLEGEVSALLSRSGVESPVTAVLLNFRGYDTLLEVMVLLLAVTGVWSLTTAPFQDARSDTSPVQLATVRLIAPLMFLVAAYLVWQGGHLAGGAFQGGAVFAGVGVILLVTDLPWLREVKSLPLRIGFAAGPLFFLFAGLYCLVAEGKFLDYPEDSAGGLLLMIETVCALSIGLTLTALFAGGRPEGDMAVKSDHPVSGKDGEA